LQSRRTAGLVQQGLRISHSGAITHVSPGLGPRSRCRSRRGPLQAAVLPQGLDQLVVDSTVPVLKIGMVAAAGAVSAHYVSQHSHRKQAASQHTLHMLHPLHSSQPGDSKHVCQGSASTCVPCNLSLSQSTSTSIQLPELLHQQRQLHC
jgi:hypothetical protein